MTGILEQLQKGLTTHSAPATLEIAAALAKEFPQDQVLALEGDLGTGKTTFMKGMARQWGIQDPILSPTYNLYFCYKGKDRNLVHLDAYRLQNKQDAESLLIEDFLESPWCLAIEWPERVPSVLTPESWHLTLENDEKNSRNLRLRIPF